MSSETKSVSILPGGHPDESQLLLALERELPAVEFAEVEQHVGSCWSCRARSDEMRRGILGFVEYREKRYLPLLDSPPTDFRSFPDQLRTVALEYRRPNVLAKVWRRFMGRFALPRQFGYASAVAVVMASILLWMEVLNPPAMSANELLIRSVAAQSGKVQSEIAMGRRIVHQRVEIRGSGKTVVRDFQWHAGERIPRARWHDDADPEAWTAPLSAQGFMEWRDSLREKRDEVQHSGDMLAVRTTNTEHQIREAVLEVRADDFRPVGQHVRFADGQEVHFREIAFEIREQLAVQQRRPEITRQDTPQPSSFSREDVELEVRHALFSRGLDLDEDILIEQEAGTVTVSGVASTAEREAAMRAALTGLAGVRIAVRAPVLRSGSDKQPGVTPTTAPSAGPLLNEALENGFPSREERLAFVDRSVGESDIQLSHAWVLKRLLDRYGSAAQSELTATSRVKLNEMLRAHLEAIRRHNVQSQLLALAPAAAVRDRSMPDDWRSAAAMLFNEVREQDSLIASLVVGTQAQGMDVSAASTRLRSSNRRIDALVRLAMAGVPPGADK